MLKWMIDKWGVVSIQMAEDGVEWWGFLNMVTKHWLLIKGKISSEVE
jgi:hypothetical protein